MNDFITRRENLGFTWAASHGVAGVSESELMTSSPLEIRRWDMEKIGTARDLCVDDLGNYSGTITILVSYSACDFYVDRIHHGLFVLAE